MQQKRYTVTVDSVAMKDIKKLPVSVKDRVWKKIETLKNIPRPRSAQPVVNFGENGYRIRVGDYRILYQINDRKIEVLVVRVRHRREAYRNL